MEYFVHDTIDSTNDEALRVLQKAGHPQSFVVAAKYQSNGHEKNGRTFYSPSNTGMYFSVVKRADQIKQYLGLLTLVVGVSVIRGFEKFGINDLKLKWVNDIVNPFGKVGGILVLQTYDVHYESYVIIGVGINIVMPNKLPSHLEGVFSPVWESVVPFDNARIQSILVSNIVSMIEDYDLSFISTYTRYSSLIDKNISLQLKPDNQISGKVSGFSEKGGILITNNGKTTEYQIGEIISVN